MPDKKLTDSEIVKALEEHYKQVDKGYSTHLEYGGKGDEHEEKYIYMLRDVLDLINRLQAENERLREKCENTQIGYNFAQDDIKTLKKDKYKLQKALNQSEDYRVIAKAEAYKEFAERLMLMVDNAYTCDIINNLLKELVGEDNAKEKE